jgi:hypothetical protein
MKDSCLRPLKGLAIALMKVRSTAMALRRDVRNEGRSDYVYGNNRIVTKKHP